MPPVEDANLAGFSDVARESDATGAQNAPFAVEFDERPEIHCFHPASFLSARVSTGVARMLHVVILQPTFS